MNTKKLLIMGTACVLVTAESLKHAAIAQAPTEANETTHVKVIGSNPEWTKISGVEADTLIRVNASGAVFFGPHSKTDTAVAGAKGTWLFQRLQSVLGGDWEKKIGNPSEYPALIKNAFAVGGTVNFDHGGVSIKIVSRATGQPISPPNLYFYWATLLNLLGFMSDSDVDVYARAHDGGKDLDNPRLQDYQDNTQAYTVWLVLSKPPRVPWSLP
jgi:hypothetical protein